MPCKVEMKSALAIRLDAYKIVKSNALSVLIMLKRCVDPAIHNKKSLLRQISKNDLIGTKNATAQESLKHQLEEMSVFALGKLAESPHRQIIVDAGALPYLVQILKRHRTGQYSLALAGVSMSAVKAISYLASENSTIKEAVLAAGALYPAIRLLSSGCLKTQKEVALLIWHFAASGSDCKLPFSIKRDEYDLQDFQTVYDCAKFFVIKSFSEDDVHKYIKYNVWSSTSNGNKKLDAAIREADAKTSETGAEYVLSSYFFQ